MASGMMKAGGVGCLLALIATFIAITAVIIAAVTAVGGQLWYAILLLIAGIITNVGLLLVSIGGIGVGKTYKNALPTVAGILGLVGVILAFVAVILVFVGVGVSWIVALAGNVLIGVFFLLFGIGLIIVRDKTGRSGLAMGTGIMFIILGSFYLSILLVLIVPFMLIPVLIMGMLVFFRSNVGRTGASAAAAAPEEKETPKNVCPACGTKMTPSEKFCGNCGKKKEPPKPKLQKNVCTECGTKLAPGAKFCGNCGKTT